MSSRAVAINGWNVASGRIVTMFGRARTSRQRGNNGGTSAGQVVVAAADMTSSDDVHDLFNRCRRLLHDGAQRVVIDLHAVTAADTKLVACLVVLHRMAKSASARLELCLSNAVLEIARICRLEWLANELGPPSAGQV